jgi:peptide/nickel transport system substrate-binding protein
MRTLRHPGALSGMASAAFVAATLSVPAVTHAASGSPAATPARGGVLNVLSYTDGDWLDPNITYYSVGYTLAREYSRQLYSMPARKGETTDTVPDLATRMPRISDHGKTYRITIRKGAKWDAAKPHQVTAADVVRGVKTTCNPARPFGGLPDYEDLLVGFANFCQGFARVQPTATAIKHYTNSHGFKGVQSSHSNPRTVIFHLTHRASYFTDMLALPAFSPRAKQMLNYLPGSLKDSKNVVADGPYRVSSYQPGQRLVFVRNPAWKGGTDPVRKAYVDKIVVNETVTQDSVQQQLQTGTPSADMEFDVAPPPSQLPALQAKKDPNLTIGDTAGSNPYVIYNTVSPNNNKALQNPKVRQAISYAINRDHILQVLGGKTLNPPLTHVLPDVIVGSKQIDPYQYNPDKAKQLLAEAGYPHLTLKFLYRNATEGSSKTFQTVQQDLTKAGITVVGVPSPNADFYVKYLQVPDVARRGVWDVSLAGWGADWYGNAALSFFNPLFSGPPSYPPVGSNFGLYNDPETNSLIQQAATAETQDQAADLWAKADARVMDQAAFYPLTNGKQANYHAAQVHNAVYVPSMQNYDPTNVWLSKDKQGG